MLGHFYCNQCLGHHIQIRSTIGWRDSKPKEPHFLHYGLQSRCIFLGQLVCIRIKVELYRYDFLTYKAAHHLHHHFLFLGELQLQLSAPFFCR